MGVKIVPNPVHVVCEHPLVTLTVWEYVERLDYIFHSIPALFRYKRLMLAEISSSTNPSFFSIKILPNMIYLFTLMYFAVV